MSKIVVTRSAVEDSVLLLDKTGSMKATDFTPSRLEAARRAAVAFLKRKREADLRDETAVVAFDTSATLVSDFGRHPVEAERDLQQVMASGDTSITTGLRLSLERLRARAGVIESGTRRIVLLSDGEHNCGPGPAEDGTLEAIRRNGIIVDTVLIGSTGEALLRAIARHTGGTFVRCNDFEALLKQYHRLAGKKIASAGGP